jgi:hypothetical protein
MTPAIFLWWPLVTAALAIIHMSSVRWGIPPLPFPFNTFIGLVIIGGAAITGAIVAAGYVISARHLKVRWGLGLFSLIVNVAYVLVVAWGVGR